MVERAAATVVERVAAWAAAWAAAAMVVAVAVAGNLEEAVARVVEAAPEANREG